MSRNPNFVECSYHPEHQRHLDSVGSLLHSVAAAKGITWKDAYEGLIQAAGAVGMMPQYQESMHRMLSRFGFFRQSGGFRSKTVLEILADCNAQFHDGETVILKVHSHYVPLVPVRNAQYVLKNPWDCLDDKPSAMWIAWKDGLDHSAKAYKSRAAEQPRYEPIVEENEALVVRNENPNDNLIGDCAVRAVAGVLEVSWEEAVRRLAAAQDYRATVINTDRNIDALLKKEGFQAFDAIRRNGKILTGKQFCDLIHDMFQPGTRIFGYVGNSHAVAILVFDGDYKIVDTWDSTDRLITRYWAKYPERPRRREKPQEKPDKLTKLEIGTKLRHTMFGSGEVTAIDGQIAAVRFANGTEKRFPAEWILANCKPV